MANTYRWYINQLQTLPTFSGVTDFVTNVIWRYNADNGEGYSAYLFGQTTFNKLIDTPQQPYIPYSALTENQVTDWLNTYADVTGLEARLTKMIDEQINPPIIVLPLPWE
jgi:hypothetical protein